MSEVEVVEVKSTEKDDLENGIIVQGDQEFPVEIALAEDIPVFKCADCGALHIGPGPGEFDESEVDIDLDELMNREKTKTPKNRIEALLRFKNAAIARGIIKIKAPVAQ